MRWVVRQDDGGSHINGITGKGATECHGQSESTKSQSQFLAHELAKEAESGPYWGMVKSIGKRPPKLVEPEFIWPGKEPDNPDWDENPTITEMTGAFLRVSYQVLYHLWLWLIFSMPATFIATIFVPPPPGWSWYAIGSGLVALAILRRRWLADRYKRWKHLRP